jgi:hypothetical protein
MGSVYHPGPMVVQQRQRRVVERTREKKGKPPGVVAMTVTGGLSLMGEGSDNPTSQGTGVYHACQGAILRGQSMKYNGEGRAPSPSHVLKPCRGDGALPSLYHLIPSPTYQTFSKL